MLVPDEKVELDLESKFILKEFKDNLKNKNSVNTCLSLESKLGTDIFKSIFNSNCIDVRRLTVSDSNINEAYIGKKLNELVKDVGTREEYNAKEMLFNINNIVLPYIKSTISDLEMLSPQLDKEVLKQSLKEDVRITQQLGGEHYYPLLKNVDINYMIELDGMSTNLQYIPSTTIPIRVKGNKGIEPTFLLADIFNTILVDKEYLWGTITTLPCKFTVGKYVELLIGVDTIKERLVNLIEILESISRNIFIGRHNPTNDNYKFSESIIELFLLANKDHTTRNLFKV